MLTDRDYMQTPICLDCGARMSFDANRNRYYCADCSKKKIRNAYRGNDNREKRQVRAEGTGNQAQKDTAEIGNFWRIAFVVIICVIVFFVIGIVRPTVPDRGAAGSDLEMEIPAVTIPAIGPLSEVQIPGIETRRNLQKLSEKEQAIASSIYVAAMQGKQKATIQTPTQQEMENVVRALYLDCPELSMLDLQCEQNWTTWKMDGISWVTQFALHYR